ncbi:hypothetical protein CN167_10120, partial [Sinorhizobium medicae]
MQPSSRTRVRAAARAGRVEPVNQAGRAGFPLDGCRSGPAAAAPRKVIAQMFCRHFAVLFMLISAAAARA